IAGVIREGHCGLLPEARLPTMVDAWHARNITMARRLAAPPAPGLTVVVIVGRGHQAAGGLPAQLAALRPGTRQLVVDMIETPPDARPEAAGGGGGGGGGGGPDTPRALGAAAAGERADPWGGLRRAPR